MHKNPVSVKEIEEYLSGQLSAEHLAEFEKRLKEEEAVKNDVRVTKQTIEGIQGYAFKQKLQEFHQKLFPHEGLTE